MEAALSLLMAITSNPHKLIVSSFKISIYKDETKFKKSSLLSTNIKTKLNLSHKAALSESKKHHCSNLKGWKRIPNGAFNQTVGFYFSTLIISVVWKYSD